MFWSVEDYPRDLLELEARFSTEAACREYLARLRWPDGFRCPHCDGGKAWPIRALLECAACGLQTSVTAGTIFQDTRTPLPVWFRAMWWVTTQKNGASALGLQRVLGLKSYETAWTWLHKLRRAMVRPGRDLLTGRIEVDEGYVGGPEEGLRGRLNLEKTLVVVAAQEDGQGLGRIRMRQIPDASAESLIPFVQDSIASGSVVHTDGWLGYSPLTSNGYQHQVTYLKGNKKAASELLPRVHLVISHLSLQPATLKEPRQALLSTCPAGCGHRSRVPGPDSSPRCWVTAKPQPTYSAYLSQADTYHDLYFVSKSPP